MFYLEEKKRWVDNKMIGLMRERPNLTIKEQKIMRGYFEKEFEDVWESRDYVYGQDEGGSPAGSKY